MDKLSLNAITAIPAFPDQPFQPADALPHDILRISGVVKESIVDGTGIRMVIFAQGCKHNCSGCHNPETHLFSGGQLREIDFFMEQIKKNPLLDGITLSGGEPFEQADSFGLLAERVKNDLGLSVWTYTGYTFETLLNHSDSHPGWKKLLDNTDILVDGRFEMEEKDLLLPFRGSRNQRILDVKKSLEQKKGILAEFN